jgi:ferredoxin
MTFRIVIDRSACSGFGSCVETDPETFAMGADGLAETLTETTDSTAAIEAARSCPMGAITVLDDSGTVVR